jgi:ABC-type polysaccharide/polyol phosphate transport system ATPase subunit
MTPILEIKNISKKFRIRQQQQPYLSLRDSIAEMFSSSLGRGREGADSFWALKDISLDVYPGESIGIIGKNGAGKSTLLKILSKITPPTEGKIISRGRIASLLEVGTGFHPELSGRENIFLNGSILGMKRIEIQKKFDAMVDFSGVEKFLDTPLKHYSSGMQLRLAFAVAAFLEPEILVIDEVLAVGDAEFQRKCLGKMEDVTKKEGRTILFVSHNISQVQSLCSRGILLNNGTIEKDDTINTVITQYVSTGAVKYRVDLKNFQRIGGKSNDLEIEHVVINNMNPIYENEPATLEMTYLIRNPISELVLGFSITDLFNHNLVECRSTATYKNYHAPAQERKKIQVTFNPKLKAGIYLLNVGARCSKGNLEYMPSVAQLEITPTINHQFESWNKPSEGILLTDSEWTLSDP